ncbi:MAG: hypothetical protein ACR2JB_14520 [Bryobacteraceae bacterium]
MKNLVLAVLISASLCAEAFAQSTFEVTGTPVPVTLVKQNYGRVPKGIAAYDLNICNSSRAKQSIVSSEIYQALSKSDGTLQPIGRHIVLASLLRSHNWSALRIISLALSSAMGVLTVINSSKNGGSGQLLAAIALGSLSTQQLTMGLKGNTSADQLEKFDSQVLEPALVLDAGSCVERTVFTAGQGSKVNKPAALSFHVR